MEPSAAGRLDVEAGLLRRVDVRDDQQVLVMARPSDGVVVARLAERGDAENRVGPVEVAELVAGHEEHAARLKALLHAHRDRATGEVFEVAADARVTGGVNRAGELVDLEDARVAVADARPRLVKGDVAVDADATVADFDAAGVFDHFGQVLENLGTREDYLALRHHQVGTDAVEEQGPYLAAEAQRVRGGDELVLLVVDILVHEEKAHVLEGEVAVVDLLRHQTVGLGRPDGHDVGNNVVAFRRLLEFVHHLLGEEVIDFVEGLEKFQLAVGLADEFVRVERENLAYFFFAGHGICLSTCLQDGPKRPTFLL